MTTHSSVMEPVVIIGGGPAGLAAAYEVTRHNRQPIVLEKRDKVGGIACTENYKGYHFDMGGHRFFTKVKEVDDLWHEVMGDDFLRRPRLSRIYYKRRFFHYPLKPLNALAGLGIWQALLVALSYLRWQLFPYRREETFEQWVTNRFGQRLFQTFFKTYTEKVWGIPCSDLKAEWAAQRIKDLSLKSAVVSMFVKPGDKIKTLIEEFDYPRQGPGMLWTATQAAVERRGGTVHLNTDVVRVCRQATRVTGVVVSHAGRECEVRGSHYISSMPITELVHKLDPPPPTDVLQAADNLRYRDFLTVCLIVDQPQLFADNWIYVHEPEVQVGRIQNFKNWSPHMVPDRSKTSLGLEYFCTEGDALWTMADSDLIELGKREIDRVGLARYADIEDGCVFRVPKSYPIYDADYREHLTRVRAYVDSLDNLQTVGRNGLHRYNNQDHAMLTGMFAARNIILGERNDLWSVNTDQEYHEEVKLVERVLRRTFLKLDPLALGGAVGAAAGFLLFVATLVTFMAGAPPSDLSLGLLNQFFPGYRVSPLGSLLGLGYGFLVGFVLGWGFAWVRNTAMFLSLVLLARGFQRQLLRQFFDYM